MMPLSQSELLGRFVETYMISEIMKWYQNNMKPPDFYCYRDYEQREVDFVIVSEGKISMVECKKGVDIDRRDVKSLHVLDGRSFREIASKSVVCLSEKPYLLGDAITAIPLSSV